jgi:hypothetical protein
MHHSIFGVNRASVFYRTVIARVGSTFRQLCNLLCSMYYTLALPWVDDNAIRCVKRDAEIIVQTSREIDVDISR